MPDLPLPATLLASSSVWVDPLFSAFLPWIYLIVGVPTALALIAFVIMVVNNNVGHFTGYTSGDYKGDDSDADVLNSIADRMSKR